MDSVLNKFIAADANLTIEEDDYQERSDICPKAIYILGNYSGFLSLMHCLLHASNELEDELEISNLPFVSSKLNKPFIINIEYGQDVEYDGYGIVKNSESSYIWKLTEVTIDRVAGSLHGLGYAFNHVHFDPKEKNSTHAVYCAIE